MISKAILSAIFASTILIMPVKAQYTAQKDAAYFAVLKAVANYKIDDEEHKKEVEELRNDERFNEKVAKLMSELTNSKSKNSKNKKIYNILHQAGKQLYNELN